MKTTQQYVGIDLHKNYSSVAILDENGAKLNSLTLQNREIDNFRNIFQQEKNYTVVVESTYGWYWLADTLSSLKNVDMKLANTKLVKKMTNSDKKTDKIDATFLANLSRVGMLPESHISSHAMREVKEILRMRSYFVQQRAELKVKLRDLLAKQNLDCPYEDVGGKKAKKWIEEMLKKPPYNRTSKSLMEMIENLDRVIAPYNKQVKEYAKFFEKTKLLKTIPGIGDITAMTLLAEIDDINRFPNAESLSSYAGLVPKVYSSGGKTYYGRLKEGNTQIKSVLGEASMAAIRKDTWLRNKYEEMKQRKNAKSAKVVIMRKLLVAVYHVLSKQEVYKAREVNE